jgi:hypothetical protein
MTSMIRDRAGEAGLSSAYFATRSEEDMRTIWNTMLKGLVAILPIGLTLYLVYWLAVTAERLFSSVPSCLSRTTCTGRASGCSRACCCFMAWGWRSTPTS